MYLTARSVLQSLKKEQTSQPLYINDARHFTDNKAKLISTMSTMVKVTNTTLTGVMRTLATTGEHPEVVSDEEQ